MLKTKCKNWIYFFKYVLLLCIILFWIFVIVYVIMHILVRDNSDANDLSFAWDIWVLLIFTSCFLINCYTLSKCEDWLYKRKDWRVYQWDWSKFFWANWKWRLTWADGSCYEWEFKNGSLCWKWKKVCPNWESYVWEWKNNQANWKWKLKWSDGSYYEWEFKNWNPHWKWIMKMNNWYYYEWEFKNWKIAWRFEKQNLPSWWCMEGEFRKNWNNGFDWTWKMITSNWFTFEWVFNDWKLSWEWKTTFPDGSVCIWDYVNWELKKWKKILKNWEYYDWNWINWKLNWLARYYFKDGSYYEWECGDMWWQWVWTYVTKKWDKHSTEFPYEIINVFMYWLKLKIKEIQWNLNYISKNEKEKTDEKNMYLEILKSWTDIQKEIAKLSLEEDEKSEKLLNSLKMDSSVKNLLNFYKCNIKFIGEDEKKCRNIADKYHINFSKRKTSSYSYSQFFFRLDWYFINEVVWGKAFVKIFQFLSSKNILDFVTKREEKDKERMILIDEFSEKYKDYIQSCIDWREYEKIFWKHNFKFGKRK